MSTLPLPILRFHYEKAFDEYVRNLTLEDLMESTPQATQRKITLMSLEALHTDHPNIQIFNELMIQYPLEGQDKPGLVVPDNMVVVHDEPIDADGSYALPFQPTLPLLVMEYVSRSSKRKDFETSYEKYEQEVRIPYFLLFDPDPIELILFHLEKGRYVSVPPNDHGRHPIPELDLEVAIVDDWVRYWHGGNLLPLTGELLVLARETRQQLLEQTRIAEEATRQAETERQRANEEQQRADAAERETARLREEIERLREESSGKSDEE